MNEDKNENNKLFEFHKISMKDRPRFDELLTDDYFEVCDYSFPINYIWAEAYNTQVWHSNDCLLLRYFIGGQWFYAYPVSPCKIQRISYIQKLMQFCRENSDTLRFTLLTDKWKEELKSSFPGQFEIDAYRDGFDYVYKREDLALLPGKRYSAKRNHLHRFYEQGDWIFGKLEPADFPACMELERMWAFRHGTEEADELRNEEKAIEVALSHFSELGFEGGVVRQNGKMIAFSIGERLNEDIFVIHFEKADVAIPGSFQIINREMANCYSDYLYFNREDDTGNQGLRKSKLSYHPTMLVPKYMAKESIFTYAEKEELEDIKAIWQSCFPDSAEYISYFLEHTYREDAIICRRCSGKVVSMAFVFPASIRLGEQVQEVKYLYAVGTLPEYRGIGLSTSILFHVAEKYGCPVLICPENEAIVSFYKNRGFVQVLEAPESLAISVYLLHDENVNIDDGLSLPLRKIEKQEINNMINDYMRSRQKRYEGYLFVEWNPDYLCFALLEHLFCGGQIWSGFNGYILCKQEGDCLLIAESTISQRYEMQAFEYLKKVYPVNTISKVQKEGYLLWADNQRKESFPENQNVKFESPENFKYGYFCLTLG
ncbi:MAG: GNAT family N-acetyltransferase [Lachnospiraceae bacterium]